MLFPQKKTNDKSMMDDDNENKRGVKETMGKHEKR